MALRRYKYRMRHTWVTSGWTGSILPCFCQEVTPGDTWQGISTGIVRLGPMNYPAFTQIKLETFYFYVPHRLTWPEFEDVVTGADTTSTWPTVTTSTTTVGVELNRFLGNGATTQAFGVNALPIRAYNAVYNEFFRDQQLQAEVDLDSNVILNANFKSSDYFARARSVVQQDDEYMIPVVDSEVSTITLRHAMAKQKMKERRSRYGERYVDWLRAIGLRVPDSRLDRPEFVARGTGIVGISEVLSTANTDTGSVGDFAGHGIGGVRTNFRKRVFVEHGTLIGLVVARPRNVMRHRIDRQFRATTRDDILQPELVQDGLTLFHGYEVNSKPVWATISAGIGYIPKYEWLRTARDTIAGPYMQDDAQAPWVASRNWDDTTVPNLNTVISVPEMTDLWQNQTDPNFIWYFDHNIGKRSLLPPVKP